MLARVASAIISLAMVPLIVGKLGLIGFGTWDLLVALASLVGMLQSAITGALIWKVSQAFSLGAIDEVKRLVRVGVGGTSVVASILVPLVLISRSPVVSLLHVPAELVRSASTILPIVVALQLVGGLAESGESVISGSQRSGIVSIIAASTLLVNYSCALIALEVGAALWSLPIGVAGGLCFRMTTVLIISRRLAPGLVLTPTLPCRSDLETARYSGLMVVGNMAGVLRDQTDKIVLAAFASPAWVGYYGVAARLANLVLEFNRFFYIPVVTATSALEALGDWGAIKTVYTRATAAISSVTGLALVLVAGLSGQLVVLWLGRPVPQVNVILWILVSGNAAAVVLTGAGTAIARGVGRVDVETSYLVVGLIFNLSLTVALVIAVGPMGTVIATGSSWVVSASCFTFLLHRRLPLPIAATRRAAGTLAVAAVLALALHVVVGLRGSPLTRVSVLPIIVVSSVVAGLIFLTSIIGLGLLPLNVITWRPRRWRRRPLTSVTDRQS